VIDLCDEPGERKPSNTTEREVAAIRGLAEEARDKAARAGLEFEAYLLNMAVMALSEKLRDEE